MLSEVREYISTRELSISIWTVVLVLTIWLTPPTRASFKDLIKSLLSWKVSLALLLYTMYMACVVWLMWTVQLWEQALLGGTVIWLLGSGMVLYSNAITDAPKKHGFFKQATRDLVKLAVVFTFLVSARPFDFVTELWLVPALAVLTLTWAWANRVNSLSLSARIWTLILGVVFIVLSGFSIGTFANNPPNDLSGDVRLFLLPVLLGVASIPAAFVAAVAAAYEVFASRLRRYNSGKRLPAKAMLGLAVSLRWDLFTIDRFPGQSGHAAAHIKTYSAARELAARRCEERKLRDDRKAASRRRLEDFAGIPGEDDAGRQLDRREFEPTKRALDWLHTCLSSRYRNTGEFQADILDVMGTFKAQGLREPHGIVVKVREDGQAWLGYRSTPSGYHFGVGASGPELSQWVFNSQTPPTGFPSTKNLGWTNSLVADTPSEWLPESTE